MRCGREQAAGVLWLSHVAGVPSAARSKYVHLASASAKDSGPMPLSLVGASEANQVNLLLPEVFHWCLVPQCLRSGCKNTEAGMWR